ncbi:MAG: hypothetical protein NC247_08730 [Ruminococcus flavefaciens]|nr:hypothetical protein [Ruminococcus flavefaciens]MCM1361554.1 hypothetical protein [Clostridiales bacterium]
MVNTIQNRNYNYKERSALYAEFSNWKKKTDEMLESASNIDDDAEYENAMIEVGKLFDLENKLYMKCFSAQFHKCRNAWFQKIVDELPDNGEYKYLTEKQYYAFKRYAYDEDENNWRDGKTYCRVGNYLITLVWHNSLRAIKKEAI